MLETFTGEGARDFNQRYRGTFGWFRDGEKKILVRVDNVNEEELRFSDEKGMSYHAFADQGVTFEFLPVERGVYNLSNDDVVVIHRIPARQWQRGISATNTNIRSFRKGLMHADFPTLKAVFGEMTGDTKQYINEFLEGKRMYVALDHQFSLTPAQCYVFEHLIGTYKNKKITLNSNLLLQEVTDLITKLQLPLTVEVANA